jgi:hypothetical protein
VSYPRQQGESAEKYDPTIPSLGGYRLNGSWDENARHTPLYELVKELRHVRRTTNETPAELVRRIPAPLLPAFPSACQWATLTERKRYMEAGPWCIAKTYTSAEASVVFAFTTDAGYPMSYLPTTDEVAPFPVDDLLAVFGPSRPDLPPAVAPPAVNPDSDPSLDALDADLAWGAIA